MDAVDRAKADYTARVAALGGQTSTAGVAALGGQAGEQTCMAGAKMGDSTAGAELGASLLETLCESSTQSGSEDSVDTTQQPFSLNIDASEFVPSSYSLNVNATVFTPSFGEH